MAYYHNGILKRFWRQGIARLKKPPGAYREEDRDGHPQVLEVVLF